MATTGILIAIAALLGWIVKILNQIRLLQASRNELLLSMYDDCDCEYPAFSRGQIYRQLAVVKRYEWEREEARVKVTNHPDFGNEGLDCAPSREFEDLMEDTVYYEWKQRRSQIRYERMIEANLAVRRGEKIIAEARQADKLMPDVGLAFGWSGCIVDGTQDWKNRLRSRGSVESYETPASLYDSGRVEQFEDTLKQQFEQWQDRRQACEGWRLYEKSTLTSRTDGFGATIGSQPTG